MYLEAAIEVDGSSYYYSPLNQGHSADGRKHITEHLLRRMPAYNVHPKFAELITSCQFPSCCKSFFIKCTGGIYKLWSVNWLWTPHSLMGSNFVWRCLSCSSYNCFNFNTFLPFEQAHSQAVHLFLSLFKRPFHHLSPVIQIRTIKQSQLYDIICLFQKLKLFL